jgi:AcrR family transcriptional regulator
MGRQEEGAQSRERMLDAGARLIAEQGYAATSVAQISKAAGVHPPSLYWAFQSKEGLLAAVMERSAERFLERQVQRVAERPQDAEVWQVLEGLADSFAEGPEFLRLLLVLSLERRGGDPDVLAAARRVRTSSAALLAAAFQADVAPDMPDPQQRRAVCDELARFTLMLLDGVFVATQIEPDSTDVRRSFATITAAVRATRDHLVREALRGRADRAFEPAQSSGIRRSSTSSTARSPSQQRFVGPRGRDLSAQPLPP